MKVLLTAKDINVNRADEYGYTPLFIASLQGNANTVKVLLAAKDINVNQSNMFGKTPLDTATLNNHKEIIQLLKDSGAAKGQSQPILVHSKSDNKTKSNKTTAA